MANHKTNFFMTPEGRFAYCFLDMPRTADAAGKQLDEPRYECVMYLPKTSNDPRTCTTYQLLAKNIQEVLRVQFGNNWPMIDPRTGVWTDYPIHDCDLYAEELQKAPWGAGHWRIRLSAGKFPPVVVDATNNKIAVDITGRFRTFKAGGGGGDFGISSINCYGYENQTFKKKGVSFGLEGIKKFRDGDPIGGGQRPVEAIFGAPTGPAADAVPSLPPGYGPQHAASPPPPPQFAPPPPPPADPTASWQRDPSGQWMHNPQTNQWEAARQAAPPPPPPQAGAPTGGQYQGAPAPNSSAGYGPAASPSNGVHGGTPPTAPQPSYGPSSAPGYGTSMPPPPPIGTR